MEKKREIDEEVKQHLLATGEISLLLDSYDDIFSDFDPRPFSVRALSDDFLLEAKKAALVKEGDLELSFMIPKEIRKIEQESLIKKRLREHFKKHALLFEKEVKQIRNKGIFMAVLGIVFILIATYLLSIEWQNIIKNFLIVILEPAGWFTAWTGLDQLYYTVNEKRPDLEFYRRMTRADVHFHGY